MSLLRVAVAPCTDSQQRLCDENLHHDRKPLLQSQVRNKGERMKRTLQWGVRAPLEVQYGDRKPEKVQAIIPNSIGSKSHAETVKRGAAPDGHVVRVLWLHEPEETT